jgi:alpha-beta hydrolase superfamily lysophospholipase
MTEFTYTGTDGKSIAAYSWIPQGDIKAVVQVVHGVVEHARRYVPFAEFLTGRGIAVYANDHRGHGKTAVNAKELGFFAEHNGWMLVVDDLKILSDHIRRSHPGLPLFLFGHSMGSFLSRTYITKYGHELSGCLLSGTATHPSLLIESGSLLAKLQALFMGKKHKSKLLTVMSFGAFNKRIKDPRTSYDWVSHDTAVVDRYASDPLCGYICSCGLFIDLMSGLRFINSKRCIKATPRELPIFIFAGTEDPVGNYGKGPTELHRRYSEAGLNDLSIKLYDGGRHEMLNELNKQEVFNNIADWLMKRSTTK